MFLGIFLDFFNFLEFLGFLDFLEFLDPTGTQLGPNWEPTFEILRANNILAANFVFFAENPL